MKVSLQTTLGRMGARDINVREKAPGSRHDGGGQMWHSELRAGGGVRRLTIERRNHGELLGIKRSLADVDLVCLGRLMESDAAREPVWTGRKVGCYRKVVSPKGIIQGVAARSNWVHYNAQRWLPILMGAHG